jgi:hypothetical protein
MWLKEYPSFDSNSLNRQHKEAIISLNEFRDYLKNSLLLLAYTCNVWAVCVHHNCEAPGRMPQPYDLVNAISKELLSAF